MLISKDVNAYQFLNDRLWRKAVVHRQQASCDLYYKARVQSLSAPESGSGGGAYTDGITIDERAYDLCLPTSIIGQFSHDLVQFRLGLEADARIVWQRDLPIADIHALGKPAECGEHAWIGFATAQA
jgi:hypothetical protein